MAWHGISIKAAAKAAKDNQSMANQAYQAKNISSSSIEAWRDHTPLPYIHTQTHTVPAA